MDTRKTKGSANTRLRTAVYLLVSLVLSLGGVILLLAVEGTTAAAIATSIIAGGIAGAGFAIIRYFDDLDVTDKHNRLSRRIASLDENVMRLDTGLDTIRSIALLNGGPDKRRLFERHPKAAVLQEVHASAKRSLEIDAIGMSLRPLFDDIVRELLDRSNARIRLLVQDPDSATFSLLCSEQGRDLSRTADSIQYTINKVYEHMGTARADNEATIEVRCFQGAASVTLTRINRVLFVRPRFPNEANFPASLFYERYDELVEPACYEAFRQYFESAWDGARVPAPLELSTQHNLAESADGSS